MTDVENKHLHHETDEDYYTDRETGNAFADSYSDLADDETGYYVKVVPSITYECEICGYTGHRFHPHRDRPTIEAPRKEKCPKVNCFGNVQKTD